ncbi:MAG: 1-acyl-sn-glycerol-3-phosphate acyltransferase [Deltaproteobacteria bacterium]|nr:1-acyl-sn-glycerol-3-phosphate acyltransferase [Candidatus Zymogenaceae bacterium]
MVSERFFRRENLIVFWTYQIYVWLIVVPFLVLSTTFFVFLGVIVVILCGDKVAHRTTGVWWARFNSYITPMRVTVLGRQNIKKGQSYVVVSNHQSSYDIFVLYGWLGIDIKWVMKKELRKVPVFGFAGKMGGNIYIDRSSPKAAYASLEAAKKKLVEGTSVVILPEGTRSKTGEIGLFKKGAFILATDLGMPILPVSISGTRSILPPGTLKLFPGRAIMKIHRPVSVSHKDRDGIDDTVKRIRDIIKSGFEKNLSRG